MLPCNEEAVGEAKLRRLERDTGSIMKQIEIIKCPDHDLAADINEGRKCLADAGVPSVVRRDSQLQSILLVEDEDLARALSTLTTNGFAAVAGGQVV